MKDGIAVLAIEGRVQMYDTDELESALDSIMEGDGLRIIVDLSGATYICSSALGVLIAAKRKMLRKNGDLRLVAVQGDVLHLLKVTMLDKLFRVFDSVEDARASLIRN